jgi:hypothetical protein
MRGTYTYVDGANLVELILEVRAEFLRRLPYELDDSRRPNSVAQVAVPIVEDLPPRERLLILGEIDASAMMLCDFDPATVFEHASTPADCLTDLTCAVVAHVLRRDHAIRCEDDRRMQLAAESLAELEDQRPCDG